MTRCFAFIFTCLILFVAPAYGQESLQVDDKLLSKVLQEERRFRINLPKSYYKQEQKYPVLYLLDGPRSIEHTLATHNFMARHSLIPEMIIVSIANTNRVRDFTPKFTNQAESHAGGGADKFLDFLQLELIPEIEKGYRTQPFKILTGHSLGGLFALHALKTRPHLFQAHFAYSPSLHWGDKSTVASTIKFLDANKTIKNYLYMNLGNEGGLMQQKFEELAQHVDKANMNNFIVKSQHYPEEDHMMTPFVGHYQALKSLYAIFDVDFANLGPNIFKSLDNHYQALTKYFGYDIEVNENIINDVGYYYLYDKADPKTAIKVFEENVKRYPNSPNVYDSLADGLGIDGQVQAAIEQMDKAISLVSKEDQRHKYFQFHKSKLIEML